MQKPPKSIHKLTTRVPSRSSYEFTRTMQAYKSNVAIGTTLVLSTESDIFKYLKGMNAEVKK